MTIVTVGIDLAKNVFAVHGVDATGKPVLLRPCVLCAKLAELIESLPSWLVGIEACSGAHHRAVRFASFGHAEPGAMPFARRLSDGLAARLPWTTLGVDHRANL